MVTNLDRGIIADIIDRILRDNEFVVQESVGDLKDYKCQLKSEISCVLFDKKNVQLPVEYKNLFKFNNRLTVIELLDNGRSAAVYIDNVGEQDFSKIIKIKE